MLIRNFALASCLAFTGPAAAEWRADGVETTGAVTAIEVDGAEVRVAVGADWYRVSADAKSLVRAEPIDRPAIPADALGDGRVTIGRTTIARSWLSAPTTRYRHGVLGDAIEAGGLVIERRDGRRGVITLGANAVFEDLWPRITLLDGVERVVVVKSYLDRGSAIAVIDPGSMAIIAETPPVGRPHAWLSPAGIADFDGNGTIDIAFVRQPHVVGRLELWSWRNGQLRKTAEVPDVSNHFIGSRALGMSWTSDFDGDGHPDLAVPSLDRKTLRLIAFNPHIREIARVPLPARMATNFGPTTYLGRFALIIGLEDGRLALVHD